jgi:hypothetical protein
MAGKKRRLSKASVLRYYLKRFSMNIGTTGHTNGNAIALDPTARKAIAELSYEETYNWITDYQPSHLAKSIVKAIAEKYHVPTTLQGLLMAYAEKIVANYILDYKGESLVEMHDNFLYELMQRTPTPVAGATSGYIYVFTGKDGKTYTVDLSVVLTEIADELFKRLKS